MSGPSWHSSGICPHVIDYPDGVQVRGMVACPTSAGGTPAPDPPDAPSQVVTRADLRALSRDIRSLRRQIQSLGSSVDRDRQARDIWRTIDGMWGAVEGPDDQLNGKVDQLFNQLSDDMAARSMWSSYIRDHPDSPLGFSRMGMVHNANGEFQDLETAAELDPAKYMPHLRAARRSIPASPVTDNAEREAPERSEKRPGALRRALPFLLAFLGGALLVGGFLHTRRTRAD
ncbi:hypothetical protein ACFL2T_02235 [Elusimicrobiota bacterium]